MDAVHSKLSSITVKELTLGIICIFAVYLIRFRESYKLIPVWKVDIDTDHYYNKRYPTNGEYVLAPVIADLESDGVNEIVLVSLDGQLQVLVAKNVSITSEKRLFDLDVKHSVSLQGVSDGVKEINRPLVLEVGFIDKIRPNEKQNRTQIIIVVFDNWEVLCFNHQLHLLWRNQLLDTAPWAEQGYNIKAMGALISNIPMQKGDNGGIIVGGRFQHAQHHIRKKSSGKRPLMPQSGGDQVHKAADDDLAHFTTFALSGNNGTIRWHHLPGDFEEKNKDEAVHHWKLGLHRSVAHVGESPWTSYGHNILQHFPHRWSYLGDTQIDVAHISKAVSVKKKVESSTTKPLAETLLQDILHLEENHVAGLQYGGLVPHSKHEHVLNPNALVIHSDKGVEVLNIYTGHPVTNVPLSSFNFGAFADINDDGTLEKVFTDFKGSCSGEAQTVLPRKHALFSAVICASPGFWAPVSFSAAVAYEDEQHIEDSQKAVVPLLVKTIGRGRGIVNHLLGRRLASEKRGYDSVFLTSSGRLSSYSPEGQLHWQVMAPVSWKSESRKSSAGVHFNDKDIYQDVFVPSMQAMALQVYDKKSVAILLGWENIALVDLYDGYILGEHTIPCAPIRPPIIGDFTGDGWNDVTVICSDMYLGFRVEKERNLVYTGVLGTMVVLVLVVLSWCCRPPNEDD